MATWCTVSDLRIYLDQVPAGAEQDAALQAALDRSEAIIARQLSGVIIEAPAPEDLKQICLEHASSIFLTKGTSSLLETISAEGASGYQYVGQLNSRQIRALRQIRLDLNGLAV